jgi:hypothetical protein
MRWSSPWPVSSASRALAALALIAAALSVPGCVVEGPPFTRCSGGEECAPPADGCYALRFTRSDGSEGEGRQCTLRCGADVTCPGDSVCLVLEGDASETPLCFATCTVAEDCFVGLRCTEVDGEAEVMSVCLP